MGKIKKKFNAEKIEKENKPIEILDKKLKSLSVGKDFSHKRRILVLCMDGISPDKVMALTGEGKLPNFNKLIKKGVLAEAKSTIPPDSVPSWPTFMTGRNPGGHGIMEYFRRPEGYDEDVVVNSSMICAKRYWDIFGDHGLSSVTMNLPVTYPPGKVKGIMISGHLTPRDAVFSYPPELCEKLREVGYFTQLAGTKFFDFDLTKSEPYLYKVNKTKEVALSIMNNYDWDIFTLGFMTPDKAHHVFGLEGERIDAVYEGLDSALGEILENIDLRRTDIFVVSDHGVANYDREFSLNSWLFEKGLVKLKNLRGQVTPSGRGFLRAVYRLKVLMNLPSVPFFRFPREIVEENPTGLCPFDWTQTRAYSLLPPTSNYLPVFINTRGERPFGIVEKGGEYEGLKKRLKEELRDLRDPYTGERVVEKVCERDELFSGKFIKDMPDVVAILKERYIGHSGFTDRRRIAKGPVFRHFRNPVLNHSASGIFIFSGPGAREGILLDEGIGIADLFPTILYAAGLAAPEGIDGRARKDIFRDEFTRSRTVVKVISGGNQAEREWLEKHSREDADMLRRELKRLGYLK